MLLFVAAPLESSETRRHPTLAMIREAARRAHRRLEGEPEDRRRFRDAVRRNPAAGARGAAAMSIGARQAAAAPGDP